jgi:DNA-3-methyladenine glycosylase I
MKSIRRCPWPGNDPLYIRYHDTEWGTPLHDDRMLFEFIVLEGAQAGLAWITVLKKRDNYRERFDQFDPQKIARYERTRIEDLMADTGIIRNRGKIEATVQNARAFLALQEQYGSFDAYIWRFVEGRPLTNHWQTMAEVPAKTPISEAMSKDLKQNGFKFVGPTICYAFMQAVGMVNDHLIDCFRHRELSGIDSIGSDNYI